MAERTALVVTTQAASGQRENGATLRAEEVVALLTQTGHRVVRTTVPALSEVDGDVDLGVAVSYACAGAVRALRDRADRVWLDAVDSWVLVNGSGLRRGRPSYALRAVRDGSRLARMAQPDLLTYISRADLIADRGSVRGKVRLVLPGSTSAPVPGPAGQSRCRRVVLAGDWEYPPNRDGLRWFTRRVLPLMEEGLGERQVAVYGSAVPEVASDRLRVHGYAADPAELYRHDDVHIAPVRFGGGVKRKVLMPLMGGLPVVTTPAGAHGLRAHPLLDVHSDADQFARAVLRRLAAPANREIVEADDLLDADDSRAVLAWLAG